MHTTMHSPKMTRSLQQISDKFGGSLPSVNKLPNLPNKLHIQAQLQNVQIKVNILQVFWPQHPNDYPHLSKMCFILQFCMSFYKMITYHYLKLPNIYYLLFKFEQVCISSSKCLYRKCWGSLLFSKSWQIFAASIISINCTEKDI